MAISYRFPSALLDLVHVQLLAELQHDPRNSMAALA
jgi:hypothetical protein